MSENPDGLARFLGRLGAMGRALPPAWDGARVTIPVFTPDHVLFGQVLPGRGLYLTRDLRTVGLTRRRIPHVYERSLVARAMEGLDVWGQRETPFFDAERGAAKLLAAMRVLLGHVVPACAITQGINGIINARAGGKADDTTWSKASITTLATSWSSLFRATGLPAAITYANIPGGTQYNRASVGSFALGQPSPTGTDKKYLLATGASAVNNINFWMLVDLLVGAGNILLTSAVAQTVNSSALLRNYTPDMGLGSGVMATLEVTTQSSATAFNVTLNKYTDQDGNTLATTGPQTGGTGVAVIVNRLIPTDTGNPFFYLASGDWGIRSVQEFTSSAALVAGVVALNLVFPLAYMPGIAGGTYVQKDLVNQISSMRELVIGTDNEIGCLGVYAFPNAGTTGALTGDLVACRG